MAVAVADDTALREVEDPARGVARINHLHLGVEVAGRQDISAARDPHRPVRETLGRIERADQKAGTINERTVAKGALYLRFAQRLQRSVRFSGDVLGRLLQHAE